MLLGRERAGDKLRRGECAIMLERGDHAAHFGNPRHVDAGTDRADTFSGIGEHFAPGIDDQRMTIAAPPGSVLTPLRRRKNKTAILDRPRTQEHMPMCIACRHGEDRRDRQKVGAGLRQRAIEVGKRTS